MRRRSRPPSRLSAFDHRFRDHRRGLTMLDLLTVIAVLAILTLIFIPAVAMSREAARRGECSVRLNQLGIACASYAEMHGFLPPGSIGPRDPLPWEPAPGESGWSWMARILPQIEEAPLFGATNFRLPPDHAVNHTAAARRVRHFLCPSESSGFTPNYVGVHDHRVTAIRSSGSGSFLLNGSVRLQDLTDGRGVTMMIAEVSNGTPGGWETGGFSTLRTVHVRPTTSAWGPPIDKGTPWLQERIKEELTIRGFTVDSTAIRRSYGTPAWPEMTGLGSSHTDGFQGLFGDGAVRFVRSDTSLRILAAWATRAGGELTDDR